MKKLEADKVLLTIILGWMGWISLTSIMASAKADRVIAVEEKVDYIYKYLIEKNEE